MLTRVSEVGSIFNELSSEGAIRPRRDESETVLLMRGLIREKPPATLISLSRVRDGLRHILLVSGGTILTLTGRLGI